MTAMERIEEARRKRAQQQTQQAQQAAPTAMQRIQQARAVRTAQQQETLKNKVMTEAAQKMADYQQIQNPQTIMPASETLKNVSTQRTQSASYPRLSIGERVGQTLAGLQEGTKTTATGWTGPIYAGKANNPKEIIQSRIDELRQKGQQKDETGTPYYKTEKGKQELTAEQNELAKALSTLYGQNITIKSVDDAEKILNRLPEVSWGRWAQVDPNAGQTMQAIEDRKDTEARSDYQDYYNKYLHLMERDDFAQNSIYRPTGNGEGEYNALLGAYEYGNTGFDDILYDYVNKNEKATTRQYLSDLSAQLPQMGMDQSSLQTMTDGEVRIYNYLYATEGRESANEYLQYLHDSLTARQRQETQQWYQDYAREHPAAASAFSVLQSPLRGLSFLGQTGDYLTDGKIDQNAAYNKFADVPNVIRETVAENWGPVGSFAYQTGMSMADFLLAMGLSGGAEAISLGIMGSGAAANTVIDAKDRGLSDNKAYVLGLIAGGAEIATEKISIEALLDMSSMGKSAVGYVLKNAFSEAGEEAASGIINLLADVIISQDESQWKKQIDQYYAQGMSRNEAVNLALRNQAANIGLDALGGALSGGIFGGAVAGANTAANRAGELAWQKDMQQAGIRINKALEDAEASQAPAAENPSQSPAAPVPALPEGEPSAAAGFEQGQNQAVQTPEQNVDIMQQQNQQGEQGFAQTMPQAQQTPVQSDAQAQTNTNDIMQTPVQTQEPQEIRAARELIAQYEANGGAQNGQQEGSVLSDGGQEWQSDTSTGEPTGGMDGGAIELDDYSNQGAVANARQNRLRNLEASRTSPEWLNLDKNVYDTRNVKMFPEELWDGQMRRAAERAFEKGADVQFFAGTMRAHGKRIDGVNLGDGRIMIQADSLNYSVDQLTDHELMHTYLAQEYGLRDEIIRAVEAENRGRLEQLVLSYIQQYEGVYDTKSAATDEESAELMKAYVIDEIICDAYAGMNRRGWGAVKLSDTVRETYDSFNVGRDPAMGRETRGPPEMRYSIETLEDGRMVAVVDSDILANIDTSNWTDEVKAEAKNAAKNALLNFRNGIVVDGKTVKVNKRSRDEYTRSNEAERLYRQNRAAYADKMRAAANADDILKATAFGEPDGGLKHERNDNFVDFARGDVLIEAGSNQYAAKTVVGITDGGEYVFYDVVDIEPTTFTKTKEPSTAAASENAASAIQESSFAQSVPQGGMDVKTRFSVSDETDSEGNELSVEQAEFFANSKIRDRQGRLIPLYHGTGSEFTVFDLARGGENYDGWSQYGNGIYLTPDRKMANYYAENARRGSGERIMQLYANIENPFNIEGPVQFDIGDMQDKYGLTDFDVQFLTKSGYRLMDFLDEHNEDIYAYLTAHGHDGVWDSIGGKVSQVVAYAENQVKNIDNRTPTSDVDIRYSVADETDSEPETETEEQKEQRRKLRRSYNARKELRTDLMNLFSIPEGLRKETGEQIESYAQQILDRGSLRTYDRDVLFDILHNRGEMEVPADEYQRTLREAVKGGKVYVPERLKAEFGEGTEDWNAFRREAFGAGIVLTNNPSDAHIDMWNQELAEMFPGAFDANETDEAWILRQIVNVAEQGKSEKMSLAEYATALSEQYGPEVIEDYYLNMERQMDQILDNFADKARFENKIRERTEGQLKRDAEYRRDQRERQRQTRQIKELQQKTLKQLQWLSKNRHKSPKDLAERFEQVLSDIDVFAVSAANEMNYSKKYDATWKDLKDMYLEAKKNDPNWLPSEDLKRIVTRLDAPKLEDFNYNDLYNLYQAALGLRQELYTRRNMLNDNRMFEEVYDQSVEEISKSAARYKGTKRDHWINLQQLTPMNVIERMAGWNPNSAWLSMGKQLEQGERDTKRFAIKANKMLQDFIEKNEDWIATADGQGKNAVWIEKEVMELTGFRRGDAPIFSDKRIKIYMTPMMRVQLYMESKSYDNLNHMLGGRRFADKDMYTKAAGDPTKRREAMTAGQIVRLTPEMVKYLCEGMSQQEMELAHILGDLYYNEFSKNEINRVSNILYGYDKAMSAWYTPIYTDSSFTKKEPGLYDATAEGAGNLKERVRMSTNPSLNLSALDAFEKSVSQTSKFVGMAIPIRNWNTLMNWRGKDDSMKNTIGQKWGDEMVRYLDDVVVQLQNPQSRDNTVLDDIVGGAMSNYISAVFGLNPSVVAKQFGSYYMAVPYLGISNMPTPKQIHNVDPELIAKYSPELDDRLMGYAIPEVAQLKQKPNWSQKNKVVEFVAGGGAITAMDGWTAKTLWPWAENKVAKETGLKRGTDEFYKRVAVEFDNAIVRSQSINDVMHRSKLMNSQSAVTRAFTMFKTDSAQSYNALREAFGEAQYMKENGDEAQKKAANRKAAGAVLGVAANNLWAAAITLLVSLWKNKGKNYRDDEGELTAASVAGQYAEDVLTSLAGTVIGGQEIADIIASVVGGGAWYGIELPGGEQLNDMVDEIKAAGDGVKEILMDAYYIVNNDGNLAEYLEDRAPDLIGAAKQMAQKIVKYLAGVPVDNLEAYLVGTLRWAVPEAVATYEDALASPDNAGLKGLEGDALEARMRHILNDRMGGATDETVAELSRLYGVVDTNVIPPEDTDEIGEMELTADQKQVYRMSTYDTISRYLDEFVASERYAEMDDEDKAKRLNTLYRYAKEVAKVAVTGAEPESIVQKVEDLLEDGMAIPEAIAAYENFKRSEDLLEAGLDPELTADLVQGIADAEEANGPDKDLSNLERYELVLDHISDEAMRVASLNGLMGEKEAARFNIGREWVDSETYIKFLRAFKDKYPDKSKSQERVEDVLDNMSGLDDRERAALWQCCNTWKPGGNPYDRSIGRELAAAIEEAYQKIDEKNGKTSE